MIESKHKLAGDGGYDKRRIHKFNVANDVHTIGEKKKHKLTMGGNHGSDTSQPHCKGGGTNRLDRFRVPSDLIFSLLLD